MASRGSRDGSRPAGAWALSLFIVGADPTSQIARKSLERICERYLHDHYTIEVIDVMKDPVRADRFEIIATPTLIRRNPAPERRVIGDLSLTAKVLSGLGLPATPEDRDD